MAPRLAIAGHVCVDVRVRPSDEYPARGRLVEAERIDAVIGGAVGNVGRALRLLGEPAYAVCRVGADSWGDLITRTLAGWADTRYVSVSERLPTSGTIVFVHADGERSFIHARGANDEFAAEHLPIDELAAAGVRHLHLGYALLLPALDGAPMVGALRRARALGITTSLDMTWDSTGRWMEAIAPLLPHVDVFCPNDAEATALTGEADPLAAARALIDAGVQSMAVVTCGARGALACLADGTVVEVAAARAPAEVTDSTGAGDCFNGGLVTALVRGEGPREALACAARTAAEALVAG
mgnify:CR=1 FL=1